MRTIPRITEGDDVAHPQLFYTSREVSYMRDRWDHDVRNEYRRVRLRGFAWGVAVAVVAWVLAKLPW
jgi:hypothetical protein